MPSNRFIRQVAGLTACFGMTIVNPSYALMHLEYASPMGNENWRMSGNPLRCGLSLTIPNYGVAYFEQYATHEPHFILRQWREVKNSISATVVAKSPVWKPNGSSHFITKSLISPGKYGIYLSRDPALKVLTYLSQGYLTEFSYKSEQGFRVSLALSPIRFQSVYGRFQHCLSGLLDFDYGSVRKSVFNFGVDQRELSDAAKNQLRMIAKYVNADVQIKVARIVGYTDNTGRHGYNNAISKDRAEAVYKYLIKLGVPQTRLSVTWLGEEKPLERNDTDEGRTANRRVEVLLIKK